VDPEEKQGEHPLDYLTMWIQPAEVGRDSEPLSLIRSEETFGMAVLCVILISLMDYQ